MSKETKLARRMGESDTPLAQDTFDLTAMRSMAEKIKDLKVFMEKNLEQGLNKDWEYAHLIWKRELKKGDDAKPCLLDPGVAKIMNFMTVRPRHRIIEKEIDTATMQLRYVLAVEIVPFLPIMYHNPVTNAMEPIYPVIAEGLGSATTREKRYKVRFEWMKERDLKVEGWTADELRKYVEENPDKYKEKSDPKYDNLYYMATAESLGLDNTLLKMGAKRACLDAVFQLPGVAGRYSQEIDLKEDRGEEKPATPPVVPPSPTEAPKQEEPKPAEKPSLKGVDLNDPVEKIIADIQSVNKGLSRAQVLQKIAEEKAKAAGLLTDEVAAYIVKDSLVPSTGFKSASELPKVPETFHPSEEAGYAIDYIVENFAQQPETVRALVYKAMNEAEPHLSDVEAVKVVREGFEKRSKPLEEDIGDAVYDALQKEALDGEIIERMEDGTFKPKKFLADRWGDYNMVMRGLGFDWVRNGPNGYWLRKG